MSLPRQQLQSLGLAIGITFIAIYIVFALTISPLLGLILAGLMSVITLVIGLIMTGIQVKRTQKALAGKQKAIDDIETHQTRTIEIDLPLSDAFDAALDALTILDGADIPKTLIGLPTKQVLKLHKEERSIGRIEAGLRAKTAGITDPIDFSKIEIQLQRLDATTTRIQIDSRPASRIETIDLGRHTHYVNQLAVTIRQQAHEQSAADRLRQQDSDVIAYSGDDNDQMTDSRL